MSIIAARFTDFPDRDGVASSDLYATAFTDLGEVKTFHKDSPDSEWQRFLAIGGKIAAAAGPYGPLLTEVSPASITVGAESDTVRFIGSGFSPSAEIVWNGGVEPTTFVSETELTTVVDPSTASGPGVVKVWVTDNTLETQHLDFSFISSA